MKRITLVLASMFLLPFIVVFSANAAESQLILDIDTEAINIKIYAPYQAYPNDDMTIRITVVAKEDLEDVTVTIKFYGSQAKGYVTWLRPLDALQNRYLDNGTVEDQYFNVSIPDVDPGLLHALITCSWKVWRDGSWQVRSIDDWCAHRVTYLRNKPYEDLQVAYDQLLANYSALLSSYDALQANYSQLLADYNSLKTSYNDLKNSHNDLQANYSILKDNHSALLTNYDELLATYDSVQNDYDDLQTNYDSLNSTYYTLLSDYTSLQASFNELRSKYEFGGEAANSLNLMYVFIETTVIFIATTMYYARSQICSALTKLKPREQKVVEANHSEKQQT